jgi:hypothetical protein
MYQCTRFIIVLPVKLVLVRLKQTQIKYFSAQSYDSLSANKVELLLLQLAHWMAILRNAICSETMGKRTVYKFTYIISFGSVIVTLMKSITVCIVVLMVCSSFLFFGSPLSQNTL